MKFWLGERNVPRRPLVRPALLRRAAAGAAALAAVGYVTVFYSGLFTVKDVRFAGAGTVPADTLARIEKELRGSNLLTLATARVERRFGGFPEVKCVVLVRHLLGGLECRLVRREPVALLACSDLIEVDGEGVMLPRRAGRGDIDLPVITGIDESRLRRSDGRRGVARALEVLAIFKSLGFSRTDQLSEIHVAGDEVDIVWAETGTLVRLGRGEYAERARKLRTVYGAFNDTDHVPDVIDLRFDRQVVIR